MSSRWKMLQLDVAEIGWESRKWARFVSNNRIGTKSIKPTGKVTSLIISTEVGR
jgi:hypothetical protein